MQRKWRTLEGVFALPGIAQQMPTEATGTFEGADQRWERMMGRAHEAGMLLACCFGNDEVKKSLAYLMEQFEACEKALSAFLYDRRVALPRLFVVSTETLFGLITKPAREMGSIALSITDSIGTLCFDEQVSPSPLRRPILTSTRLFLVARPPHPPRPPALTPLGTTPCPSTSRASVFSRSSQDAARGSP